MQWPPRPLKLMNPICSHSGDGRCVKRGKISILKVVSKTAEAAHLVTMLVFGIAQYFTSIYLLEIPVYSPYAKNDTFTLIVIFIIYLTPYSKILH